MLFNSTEFLVFLFIVMTLYFSLNKLRLVSVGKFLLVGCSLVFYSWFDISNLPIIVVSILVNYVISHRILQTKNKLYLLAGIVFNIFLLGYYKYFDFLVVNTNDLFGTGFEIHNIALPLAISFFTLQQIAYLIDIYEGLLKKQSFIDYVLFVSFFPQLIIGPIVHHSEMMPQFKKLRTKLFSLNNVSVGILLFAIGFMKKILIADNIAPDVNFFFDEAQALTLIEAWQASLGFTFQLYFDFSGYTDMALGIALMLNIKLPINFNSPLKAVSIIDFWLRWHITLTNFLTTYIYTPILYSFKKLDFKKSLIAVFITFVLCGIWHGAGWTYIVFGVLHASILMLNHVWRRYKLPMNKLLGWFLTFNFVNITFTIFRAKDMDEAWKILSAMFDYSDLGHFSFTHFIFSILIAALIAFTFKNSGEISKKFLIFLKS